MILDKLVAVLERLDESQRETRKRITTIENNLRSLNGVLGSTTGFAEVRGVINTSPENLRVAMQEKGQFDLECVQMDVQFSSAIYMAASPKNQKQIRKLLEEKQVSYLKSVLENHKKLNEMAEFCDDFMTNANANLQERVVEVQNNVKKHLTEGEDSVVSKMNVSASRLKTQNDKIDKALETLDAKIEEVNKIHVQAHAVMANHIKPKNKIYRPEMKR